MGEARPTRFFVYCCILLWIANSTLCVLLNKYILFHLKFSFPCTLAVLHMAAASLSTAFLVRFTSHGAVPSLKEMGWQFSAKLMGVACLFALVLFLSNSAFMFLSVPSIQMLKVRWVLALRAACRTCGVSKCVLRSAVFPCWSVCANLPPPRPAPLRPPKKAAGAATTFCIGMVLGVERYCHMALLKVTVVGAGVVIASYGDAKANLFGVGLQVGAILGDALRIILLQLVMQQSHVKLSPVATLFYIAPAAVLAFWLPVATIELPRLLVQDAPIPWVWLAFSCAAATGLNLVGFTLISATSALTASISGPLKDWVCVVAAMAVFKTPVSTQQWCGYLVAFCGIAWYQYDKFWGQPTKSVEVVGKSAEAAQDTSKSRDQNGTPSLRYVK
jgi:hypothetical protein